MLVSLYQVLAHVPIARDNAQRDFGCPGVVFDGAIGPRGMLATHVGDMGQRSDAAFVRIRHRTSSSPHLAKRGMGSFVTPC